MIRRVALAIATALAASCNVQPIGHALVWIDTDAPVMGGDVPALFDRIRVELWAKGASEPCAACTRDFDATTTALRTASFEIQPLGSRDGLVARVRLFRSVSVIDSVIAPASTIDLWISIPPIPEEGEVAVSAFLPTDAVGFPLGTRDAPMTATPGHSSPSHVGTWPGAERKRCTGSPAEGEVCVPGGAFFMGNAALFGVDRERLVVVSPFWTTNHEITVGEARGTPGVAAFVAPWSGSFAGRDLHDWCRGTPNPGPFDDWPLNCISFAGARAFCTAHGGDLLSEAQFEYLAGGLASHEFPWGNDAAGCRDSVWGRGGGGPAETGFSSECLYPATTATCDLQTVECGLVGSLGGELPIGIQHARSRDRVDLEGGTVWDIVGNLRELVRDHVGLQDDPCWSKPTSNVFVDPVCDVDTTQLTGPLVNIRGGGWRSPSSLLHAAQRWYFRANPNTGIAEDVGFRCARPAR